jgi:predicted glycosyltransferase
MSRYLFSSHDGYGLGHVRRNVLIAHEVLRRDPGAQVTLLTGVPGRLAWAIDPRISVVRVPPLLKDGSGAYRNPGMDFEDAIAERARIVDGVVEQRRPDVMIVDRHPFGTAGELRPGLQRAREYGASLVLGLRDVIDEPDAVRAELAGQGWDGAADLYQDVLVYGDRLLCDHELEYGLPVRPQYCGWVVPAVQQRRQRSDLRDHIVIGAGGGGDGRTVFDLGAAALALRPRLRAVVTAGPYAGQWQPPAELASRLRVIRGAGDLSALLADAGGAVQMAGYNSTVECLAAGLRPILVPRRSPRREQAIRAGRLASLGLADIVDEAASPAELAWLLDQPRRLRPQACADAGFRFDGADRAATLLTQRAAVAVA